MNAKGGMPLLKSKFLTDLGSNGDDRVFLNDSDDSDCEPLKDSSAFIVDTKGENNDKAKTKLQKTKNKFNSQIKTSTDTSGYFDGSKPLDAMNALSAVTVNTEFAEKTVIKPGIEKDDVSLYRESKRERKRRQKLEKEKTKGEKWFNLPATEMTEEKKQDLMILQMRSALDPKHFYKKSDWKKELPKYFQVGTVVDSPVDFYRDRIPKKERKSTLVDELLADAEFRKWNKKKYVEAMKNNPYYLKIAKKKQKQKQRGKESSNPKKAFHVKNKGPKQRNGKKQRNTT